MLDDLDRQILQRVQSGFPVAAEPYAELGTQLGMTAGEVLDRVRRMTEAGVIREVGAVFDLHKLGYQSTLCAAKVAPSHVEKTADFINGFEEVTHNYLRNDPFNVWFTVIAESEAAIEAILNLIRGREGVAEVLSLPAQRLYKIKVQFDTVRGQS